jgi:hypothetical protein
MRILLVLLFSFNLFASDEGCMLKGSFTYADDAENYERSERLFRGFDFITPRDDAAETQAAIDLYNAQNDYIKKLILTARTQSDSTGIFFESNPPSVLDLVSYMDYLAIDKVLYKNPKTQKYTILLRVDIAVGGGNGAYLYFVEDYVDGELIFKKVYEDFDGDLLYCAPEYEL